MTIGRLVISDTNKRQSYRAAWQTCSTAARADGCRPDVPTRESSTADEGQASTTSPVRDLARTTAEEVAKATSTGDTVTPAGRNETGFHHDAAGRRAARLTFARLSGDGAWRSGVGRSP